MYRAKYLKLLGSFVCFLILKLMLMDDLGNSELMFVLGLNCFLDGTEFDVQGVTKGMCNVLFCFPMFCNCWFTVLL